LNNSFSGKKKSDNLPIFFRIRLLGTMNQLKIAGGESSVVFIKDNIDGKGLY